MTASRRQPTVGQKREIRPLAARLTQVRVCKDNGHSASTEYLPHKSYGLTCRRQERLRHSVDMEDAHEDAR